MLTNAGQRLRLGSALSVIAAISIVLSGCAILLPSRPNAAPIYLVVQDGEYKFLWCGETYGPLESLVIKYRVVEGGEKVYHVAAQGSGRFTLTKGKHFTLSEPPNGLTYTASEPIPLDDYPMFIYLFADPVDRSLPRDLAIFNFRSPDRVEEGVWYSTGGPVQGVPC